MLFSSNDGSDDVFMVGWNSYWRSEFELADRQLSEAEIAVADMYHSRWARNNAVAYFLKPTFANAAKLGISEALSQWTDPELVVGGLSAGVSGLSSVVNASKAAKAATFIGYHTGGWVSTSGKGTYNFAWKPYVHMQSRDRKVPIQILDEVIKNPMHTAPDPQGSKAVFYYSRIWRGEKEYNIEVLYHKGLNEIFHFKYNREAMGNLPPIK